MCGQYTIHSPCERVSWNFSGTTEMGSGIRFWTCHDFNLAKATNSTGCVLQRTSNVHFKSPNCWFLYALKISSRNRWPSFPLDTKQVNRYNCLVCSDFEKSTQYDFVSDKINVLKRLEQGRWEVGRAWRWHQMDLSPASTIFRWTLSENPSFFHL